MKRKGKLKFKPLKQLKRPATSGKQRSTMELDPEDFPAGPTSRHGVLKCVEAMLGRLPQKDQRSLIDMCCDHGGWDFRTDFSGMALLVGNPSPT